MEQTKWKILYHLWMALNFLWKEKTAPLVNVLHYRFGHIVQRRMHEFLKAFSGRNVPKRGFHWSQMESLYRNIAPDKIRQDQCLQFLSPRFQQIAAVSGITCRTVGIETPRAMSLGENTPVHCLKHSSNYKNITKKLNRENNCRWWIFLASRSIQCQQCFGTRRFLSLVACIRNYYQIADTRIFARRSSAFSENDINRNCKRKISTGCWKNETQAKGKGIYFKCTTENITYGDEILVLGTKVVHIKKW